MTETTKTSQHCNTVRIPSREELHRRYGGRIYQSDFSDCRGKDNIEGGSAYASRIERDFRWEEKLILGKGKGTYKW